MHTLLLPKFHRPLPPKRAVVRPALLARLHAGLAAQRPLTLIAAAAGYGKTTLAAQWASQLTTPATWLTLEPADDDPLRFATYLVAALQRLHPSIGTNLLPVLRAGQLPPEHVLLTTLLNDLDAAHALRATQQQAAQDPFVCFLDDVHAIQQPQNLSIVQALLSHPSPGLHLVLVTREDPALPLARLRARAQLTEVRAADLRFSEAETTGLLCTGMGLSLASHDLASLHKRTEGWAVGLQLVGLSLQDHADPAAFVAALSGSHRFILDYLTEEVLARQPADRQQFLLETSLLTRLHGALCDAVTGRNDSAALLEELLRANLFIIPLDDEGRWYRYHQLFAELLQHKLRRERGACMPTLHRRASEWYERQGMPATSIEHALAADDEPRVVTLLTAHGWHLLTREQTPMLAQWIQALPEAARQRSPHLNTMMVWRHILHGAYQQAPPYLAAAHRALAHLPPESSASRALQADILALQAFLAQVQGQPSQALTLAEQARSLVPPEHTRLQASTSLALGVAYRVVGRCDEAIEALEAALHAAQAIDDHVTAIVVVAHLALIWHPLGRLHRLIATAEAVIERTETISRVAPLMIGTIHAVIGQVYYEWNQVAKARHMLLHGLQMAQLSGQTTSVAYVSIYLARVAQETGDQQAAARYLREAGDVLARGGAPAWVRLDWIAQQVALLVAQGKLAEAEASLRETGITPETPVSYQSDTIHLAWLRWQIASRQPQALTLAQRIVQSAEAQGRNGSLIQALVLGAKAGGGQAWLIRARQLGEPEGYQRIFMATERTPNATPALIEPLTEREHDVLRLLATGLTYAQIAEQLIVSINTVRYHVKGVYGKLGVEKQMQAVERGRALGLLSYSPSDNES
ncbi:LuxR C-terminal-related transcriptional regulator [Candidatus Viridilinea mediisalina]|nr:LuxR C-terminal-related transcriptional regulator [Candidatus Viridilinea mediisalina]